MQIILCDDNVQILKQLQTYITEFFCSYGASPELATYTSGEELLQNVDCADIAFLDVEMAGINGIYVGTEIRTLRFLLSQPIPTIWMMQCAFKCFVIYQSPSTKAAYSAI